MYSFTLPYIHSGPGFPIVLVGTFNKAKDIKAPSLNIVFREIVLTPLGNPQQVCLFFSASFHDLLYQFSSFPAEPFWLLVNLGPCLTLLF